MSIHAIISTIRHLSAANRRALLQALDADRTAAARKARADAITRRCERIAWTLDRYDLRTDTPADWRYIRRKLLMLEDALGEPIVGRRAGRYVSARAIRAAYLRWRARQPAADAG